jgi:hypothetical protein
MKSVKKFAKIGLYIEAEELDKVDTEYLPNQEPHRCLREDFKSDTVYRISVMGPAEIRTNATDPNYSVRDHIVVQTSFDGNAAISTLMSGWMARTFARKFTPERTNITVQVFKLVK